MRFLSFFYLVVLWRFSLGHVAITAAVGDFQTTMGVTASVDHHHHHHHHHDHPTTLTFYSHHRHHDDAAVWSPRRTSMSSILSIHRATVPFILPKTCFLYHDSQTNTATTTIAVAAASAAVATSSQSKRRKRLNTMIQLIMVTRGGGGSSFDDERRDSDREEEEGDDEDEDGDFDDDDESVVDLDGEEDTMIDIRITATGSRSSELPSGHDNHQDESLDTTMDVVHSNEVNVDDSKDDKDALEYINHDDETKHDTTMSSLASTGMNDTLDESDDSYTSDPYDTQPDVNNEDIVNESDTSNDHRTFDDDNDRNDDVEEEEEISIDTSLIQSLINDPDVRIQRPSVIHNMDEEDDNNESYNNEEEEDLEEHRETNTNEDNADVDETISSDRNPADTVDVTMQTEENHNNNNNNNNNYDNNDNNSNDNKDNDVPLSALEHSDHSTPPENKIIDGDNTSNLESNQVNGTMMTTASKMNSDDSIITLNSNAPSNITTAPTEIIPEQKSSSDDNDMFVINDAIRNTLIRKLNYKSIEVDRLKPSIANIIVKNNLFRPPEGVPTHWFVESQTPHASSVSASPLHLKVTLIRRVLIQRIIPTIIVTIGVISASPSIHSIAVTKKLSRTKPILPSSSMVAPNTSLIDTTTGSSNQTLPSIETPTLLGSSSDTSDSDIALTQPSTLPPSSLVQPEVRPSKSLKPLMTTTDRQRTLPPDVDVTWLDKFITKIENQLKSIFQ